MNGYDGDGAGPNSRPGAEPSGARFAGSVASFVWKYVAQRPWHFGGLLAFTIGAAVCAILVQVGMKMLVDALALPSGAPQVWTALSVFIALIAVESVLWRASGWLGSRTIIASGVDIRLHLFDHLAGHSVGYFADRLGGSLGHRITGTAGNFGALVSTAVWNITPPCTDFIGALVIFALLDWRMAGGLACFVLLVAAGLMVFGVRGRPYHQRYADKANKAGGELVDSVANIWAVKAFAARSRECARLSRVFGVEAAAQRASWLHLEKTRVLHDACLWILASGMLLFVIHLWSLGRVTPGDVVLVSALTFRILHGARDLALALIGAVQNVTFIGDTLREIGQPHEVRDRPGAAPLKSRSGAIRFDRVCFTYPGRDRLFSGFDLVVPAGQKIGVVGPSGAGKSTLLSLVQRFHDVQGGAVLIDDQAVTAVTQDSLRQAIAVVPQDIVLFHRSVLENIRYGRPGASDHEVHTAARLSGCEDFILELPDGYGTIVGERGMRLSGGQRQRLAIARAVLKDAPILLLDEATSSLDSGWELQIRRALALLERERTVIAVAHRLSTIIDYDRVVVLQDGRIVEDGAPRELLRRSGPFASMWSLQAAALRDTPASSLVDG